MAQPGGAGPPPPRGTLDSYIIKFKATNVQNLTVNANNNIVSGQINGQTFISVAEGQWW